MPPDGLNIRWPDTPLEMEARLLDYKLYAALAYCRANKLNHTVIDSPHARFGIVASGKAYLDTRQALADLGLDEQTCKDIGIRLFKCGMVWPLEATAVRSFAEGLEEILVVEEKRQLLEYALKEELFSWIGTGKRVPRVIGKFDEKDGGEWAVPQGNWILPAHYEFSPAIVAKAIAQRIGKLELPAESSRAHADAPRIIDAKEKALAKPRVVTERTPYLLLGLPAQHVDRRARRLARDGGHRLPLHGHLDGPQHQHLYADGRRRRALDRAGAVYEREAHFREPRRRHLLPLGFDGGARRGRGRCVDHVQDSVQRCGRDDRRPAARRTIVGADDHATDGSRRRRQDRRRHRRAAQISERCRLCARRHRAPSRRARSAFSSSCASTAGVSVMVYDQTCASEKRRRRKKNTAEKTYFPDPARRVVINELVCEGCGDCNLKSNCLSVEPLETEFGRKRKINQSTCNKDYSCLNGFCPSFVTVEGGQLKKGKSTAGGSIPKLPQPALPSLRAQGAYGIVVTGVGGTGVVTIGQLLGMAAHLEGKGISVLDMAGLAQKGGAVFSHVQIAPTPEDLYATRIAMGEADVVLGCDLIVTTSNEALSKIKAGVTKAMVNSAESPTADFVRNPNWQFGSPNLATQVREAVEAKPNEGECAFVDASALATALMGDCDLHQPADARLRMAKRLDSARLRNSAARDRDQRGRGRCQQESVRMGSRRRARRRNGQAHRIPG